MNKEVIVYTKKSYYEQVLESRFGEEDLEKLKNWLVDHKSEDNRYVKLYEIVKDISFEEVLDMFKGFKQFPDFTYESWCGEVIESVQDFFEEYLNFTSVNKEMNCFANKEDITVAEEED